MCQYRKYGMLVEWAVMRGRFTAGIFNTWSAGDKWPAELFALARRLFLRITT
jgi:hypothetical protein